MAKRYELRYGASNHNRNQGRTPRKSNSKNKKIILTALAFAVIIGIATVLLLLPKDESKKPAPSANVATAVGNTNNKKEEKTTKIEYVKTHSTVDFPKENEAVYGIVVDTQNNSIVVQRKPHQKAYPASTTKIMTLLVAVENTADFDATFTMTYEITDPLYVAGASVAGFKDGEKVTFTDLLYGTILPSGADAAIGLAQMVAGSEEEFVKLMNEKVGQLGLENTHFNNVTGLHHQENYTTVYDMAIILDAALQNEKCKEILSTYQYTTEKTKQNPEGILLSSTLFNYMYGTEPETATILGGKTGYVTEAGYCIASYGTANDTGNEYIVVTFDSPGKWPAFNGQIDLYKEFAK